MQKAMPSTLHSNRLHSDEGNHTATTDHIIVALYFLIYLIITVSMLIRQPFGNPPDEINRYLIPEYIAAHGTLPNGYEESIRIPGYGFSYAFQPILPYMLQGYAMRLVQCFTGSETALLYVARGVNLLFGLITALFVLLLSKKWFSDKRWQYLFAFLVTFLPQSIFLHTYVNTDSCCMMSIAIMLYGLTLGLKDRFSVSSSVILSIGIILCALSYYNAYGFILSCILLFFANYLSLHSLRLTFDWKAFLRKGLFISVLVLLGIAWWFIRSYLLYDGDFLGLEARDACASLYAIPSLHPDTRVTWQNQGYSMLDMLLQSDFINLSTLSFIGIYGPMTITTSLWVYRFYKLLFPAGILLCFVLNPRHADTKKSLPDTLYRERPAFRIFYHCNMVFCILMPCVLSAYYSYTTDYQPQGRYLLPALIPVCYYCIRGLQKAWFLFSALLQKCQKKKPVNTAVLDRCFTGLCVLLCIAIVCCLFVTVYGYAFPYYAANPV